MPAKRAPLLDEDDAPGITSPDYVVMTAVEGRLSARWFYQWFRSRYGAEFIKSMTRGAVRERLMFRRLAPATLVLPDWKRQQTASAQFAEIKESKAKLAEKLEALDHLPAALLREAFGGNPANERKFNSPLHNENLRAYLLIRPARTKIRLTPGSGMKCNAG